MKEYVDRVVYFFSLREMAMFALGWLTLGIATFDTLSGSTAVVFAVLILGLSSVAWYVENREAEIVELAVIVLLLLGWVLFVGIVVRY